MAYYSQFADVLYTYVVASFPGLLSTTLLFWLLVLSSSLADFLFLLLFWMSLQRGHIKYYGPCAFTTFYNNSQCKHMFLG